MAWTDRLARTWDKWKRRRFGRYRIENPRAIAERAPYTFFLPSENELLALAPGDLAKLNFHGDPPGPTYEAERMWVQIVATDGDRMTGRLDNAPFELHQLRAGDLVDFSRDDVIDLIWSEARTVAPPQAPLRRDYWERCLVDRCILDDGVPVHYLYREQPDLAGPDDSYPDSGWRIRADEQSDPPRIDYIALGKVLNADDSWLHLIDAPIGSAFIRDAHGNMFVPCAD